MFTIEFFETDDGKKPVIDFLLMLDKKMRTKVLRNISTCRQTGTSSVNLFRRLWATRFLSCEHRSAITSRGCCTSFMSAKRLS